MIQRSRKPSSIALGLARVMLWGLVAFAAACSGPSPTPTLATEPLRLVAPASALPDSVLASFTRESGIAVERLEAEEAEAQIRAGASIDLALLPAEALPGLIEDGLLAPVDLAALPGFRNLPTSFRDLAFDPGNRYAIPLRYGIIGLVLRLDSSARIPASWDEALDTAGEARLLVHARPRELIGAALLAEGRQADLEDPAALDAALGRWLALSRRRVRLLESGESGAAALEEPGILIGRAGDLAEARAAGLDAIFVVPREGAMLWIEHLALPAASARQAEATRLIEHLLRPEVAADLAREAGAAVANEALTQRLAPGILADRTVWPEARVLRRARLMLPLEPAGRALHAALWEQLQALLMEPGR